MYCTDSRTTLYERQIRGGSTCTRQVQWVIETLGAVANVTGFRNCFKCATTV